MRLSPVPAFSPYPADCLLSPHNQRFHSYMCRGTMQVLLLAIVVLTSVLAMAAAQGGTFDVAFMIDLSELL